MRVSIVFLVFLCLPMSTFSDSEKQTERIILAGGCFWGMEELFRGLPGVLSTEVGYAGGKTTHPSYKEVSSGKTGHAEALLLEFSPEKTSLAVILDFYFRIHDPSTLNRQGNDRGTQYRSAIFLVHEAQRQEAEAALERAKKSGRWKAPLVTEIVLSPDFYAAEAYHQDYLQKNPGGYTCHYLRD